MVLYTAETAEVVASYDIVSSPALEVVVSYPLASITISGGATQTAGDSNVLTITATMSDSSGYTGNLDITFSGADAIGGNTPTVTDLNGIPVAFGTPTTITFVDGTATAGGSMVLYAAQTAQVVATNSGGASSSALEVTVSPLSLIHI